VLITLGQRAAPKDGFVNLSSVLCASAGTAWVLAFDPAGGSKLERIKIL
jgi:hypothetical protein